MKGTTEKGRQAGVDAPIRQSPSIAFLGRKRGGGIAEEDPCVDDYEETPAVKMKRKRGGGVERAEGGLAHARHDRPRRASGGGTKKWISGAIKHPGALHRELGVPEGEKIPEKKLESASHSDNPTLRRRANLAKTLKKMH